MKTIKRIISTLVCFALLIGVVPAAAKAAEAQTDIKNDSITVEGTNGLGTLLSQGIQQQTQQTSEGYTEGYNIIELQFKDGVATVQYCALEDAVLVVAVYTEDGLQMVSSAETRVLAKNTSAEVPFAETLPDYFKASAYLLNASDYSPLCEQYSTSIYTKSMQDLLVSTAEDYDVEKVWNLDEDKTTNFVVYGQDTIVLRQTGEENRVVLTDDEKKSYVVENADASFTSLQTGDVVVYHYGAQDVLIAKVAKISVTGTTVTITGDDLAAEEVFSHIKIQSAANTGDFTVDTTNCHENVTYLGTQEAKPAKNTRADINWEDKLPIQPFEVKEKCEKEIGDTTFEMEVSLAVTIGIDLHFEYYSTPVDISVKLTADAHAGIGGSIEGKITFDAYKLGEWTFSPVAGIEIGLEPTISASIELETSFNISVSKMIGFSASSKSGRWNNLSTPLVLKGVPEIKCEVFVGLDLQPTLEVVEGYALDVDLTAMVGVVLATTLKGTEFEEINTSQKAKDEIHNCKVCLQAEFYPMIRFGVEVEILDLPIIRSHETEVEIKLSDTCNYYYSFTYKTGGFTKCPYTTYLITVEVYDETGAALEGAAVTAQKDTQVYDMGTTNADGFVSQTYIPEGSYTFTAGEISGQAEITGAGRVVLFGNNALYIDTSESILGSIDRFSMMDAGSETASGSCGAKDADVTWRFMEGGLLVIEGTGAMEDYTDYNRPWYNQRKQIRAVFIGEGVTHIGSAAFQGFTGMTDIVIAETVTSIGAGAFENCRSISEITLPKAITEIKGNTFSGCESLETVNLPEGITQIGDSAFYECKSLKFIDIPKTVTAFEKYAFGRCESLEYIVIPNGITDLASNMFNGCSSLSFVSLPGTLTSIPNGVFWDCVSLAGITLPEKVTYIGGSAFNGCKGLKELKIPAGVTYIDDMVFQDCILLTEMVLPEGITSIEGYTFHGCTSLERVNIPKNVTSIGSYAFSNCYRLQAPEIPASVKSIGSYAFNNCQSIQRLVIPEGVTQISEFTVSGCTSLTEITIPESVTFLAMGSFSNCTALAEVTIPQKVTSLGVWCFAGCSSLTELTIPKSVVSLGQYIVSDCESLGYIVFEGNAPQIYSYTFTDVSITAYYPAGDETWVPVVTVKDSATAYGGNVNWVSYAAGAAQSAQKTAVQKRGVSGGEYETEKTDTQTLKHASFKDLVPGQAYLMLALVDLDQENLLTPSNVLYIDQAVAAEDGTLQFTYIQRVATGISYVMVCGSSVQDLREATVIFPQMLAASEKQTVKPTVVYDGKVLTEGVDYTVSGTVVYTEAGTYTCYITGIRRYTGMVVCQYTVVDAIPGDLDGNDVVDEDDVIYLLQHLLMPNDFTVTQSVDYDGSETVDEDDVIYLLQHLLMPDEFPL